MPDNAKITLSDNELSLVKNAAWILTKQRIIEKVFALFAANIPVIERHIIHKLAIEGLVLAPPKINKGESYQQLPYVILDHPRYFNKEDAFAVRTMFWWGNFFSITLHLAGIYKHVITESLVEQRLVEGFFICVNEAQWQHHFEADNYLPLDQFSEAGIRELLNKNIFMKIAIRFPLDAWNDMPAIFEDGYTKMGKLLSNFPNDEKDL